MNSILEAQHPKTSITSQSPPAIGNPNKAPLVSQSSFGSGNAHSPNGIVSPTQRIVLNRSGSIGSSGSTTQTSASTTTANMPFPIVAQLETILNRHSLSLLDNFGIRDLGKVFL